MLINSDNSRCCIHLAEPCLGHKSFIAGAASKDEEIFMLRAALKKHWSLSQYEYAIEKGFAKNLLES